MALRRQAKKRRLMIQLLPAQPVSEHLNGIALIYDAHSQDPRRARSSCLQHHSFNRLNCAVEIVYVSHLFKIN